MRVSKRIEAIAQMVTEPILYDVGCDHAYLDIYCALHKNTTCIAIDINQNALANAQKNVDKYNLNEQIKVALNDGLTGIDDFKNSVVVLAGMGTRNILQIVKDKKIEHLVIQSNNELSILRRAVVKMGYYIDEEKVVKEGKIFNIIISFRTGHQKYRLSDYLIGPHIRHKKLDINQEYIRYLINTNQTIIKKLPSHLWFKKLKLFVYNYILKKELV